MRLNWVVVAAVLATGWTWASAQTVVTKTADGFEGNPWKLSQWNSGAGDVSLVEDEAAGGASTHAMKLEAKFSGKGFEGVSVNPPESPMVIPGRTMAIMLRVKRTSERYGLKMGFVDGWGRGKAGNKELAWDLPLKSVGKWETVTFNVPKDWVQPIAIESLTTHNWSAQTEAATAAFVLDELQVQTDLADVEMQSGALKSWTPDPKPADAAKALKQSPRVPMLSTSFSTGVEANVFAGEKPQVNLTLRNWKPQALSGTAMVAVLDSNGAQINGRELKVAVESTASYQLPLEAPRFGLYTLKTSLTLSDGTATSEEMHFANLPPPHALSEVQKDRSPYGLNVHSGNTSVIAPFKKAGIVWFREYGFNLSWMIRAKGADKRYTGWPNYQRIVKAYKDADVRVLAVLMGAIHAPKVENGKVVERIGPDEEWTAEVTSAMLGFPQVKFWEMDNEYDLNGEHARAEKLVDWANYRAYHRKLGEIASVLGGRVAVENGRAGVFPDRVKECVESGDFDKIAVMNAHHYCGTDGPETNLMNNNTGTDPLARPTLFYDQLRAHHQNASADGRKREAWLTEFGWDNLAGPVVSPYEQAVYLQRAWMLSMAAGIDKSFWFYNFDAANPKAFFDGCGLLSAKSEPKLALCALAGMTSVLPNPKYVGSLNAGEQTWGYMFENDGKMVAALWALKDGNGPSVSIRARQFYDYLGNPRDGASVQLTTAPVFAVDVDQSDLWYKQTAYEIKTPLLMASPTGQTIQPVLTVANNRGVSIQCSVALVAPDGAVVEQGSQSLTVPPGEKRDVAMAFMIKASEAEGMRQAKFVVSEGQKIKELPFSVLVQPPLAMNVTPLMGRPGVTEVTARVVNRSDKVQNAALKLKLPGTWKTATAVIGVADLKPRESRDVKINLTWSTEWRSEESAAVDLVMNDAVVASRPIIPNQYVIHAASGIKLDGDLSDWPAQTALPGWMIGTTATRADASVRMAWAKEGLYLAIQVSDSKLLTKDPASFWNQDALELLIGTRGDARGREFETGDHHFWLVPQVEQNRVYVGQWKHKNEIAATLRDIPNIQSAAKRTADGYVMEVLLPAGLLKNYQPVAGESLRINLNLAVHGKQAIRDVYWPNAKQSGALGHPEQWGMLKMAP